MNPNQRTEQWFREREGKLTASVFSAAAGLGPGSRQQAWRRHFNLETFSGSEATDWGVQHEDEALAKYAQIKGTTVVPTGFHVHPDLLWLGCSPDGLVDDGLVEVKCPFNCELYAPMSLDHTYMPQVQGQMEVMNRPWCDFVVWTPERMSIQRVYRSPEYWRWLRVRLAEWWTWVEAEIEPPRQRKPKLPPIEIKVDEQRTLHFTA